MQKNFETRPANRGVTDEMLREINKYTRQDLTADDVFVFSVLLCDNEVDRDFERFSQKSLRTLAELFRGKTAIQNHSMDSADQSARTFLTEVVTDETKRTSLGEPYTYLKAYCYMPRIEKNEARIAEINAGIKKEVSVGCAVRSSICSVCGADERISPCKHRRGKTYNGKVCHYVLEDPTDAYEWSFVAVPAQKNAGVTKHFSAAAQKLGTAQKGVTLTAAEARALHDSLERLQKDAKAGEQYRSDLCETASRGLLRALPALSAALAKSLCEGLDCSQLRALSLALAEKNAPRTPQLAAPADTRRKAKNERFKF